MKWRIALWILAGFAVSCIWVMVGLVIPRGINLDMWTGIAITAPAAVVSRAIHGPLSPYAFIAIGAAIYGLLGLAVEPLVLLSRRNTHSHRP